MMPAITIGIRDCSRDEKAIEFDETDLHDQVGRLLREACDADAGLGGAIGGSDDGQDHCASLRPRSDPKFRRTGRCDASKAKEGRICRRLSNSIHC
jgi:hypothetical protein